MKATTIITNVVTGEQTLAQTDEVNFTNLWDYAVAVKNVLQRAGKTVQGPLITDKVATLKTEAEKIEIKLHK